MANVFQDVGCEPCGGPADDLKITCEMIQAGMERYLDLNGEVGSAYLVEEVYRAMKRLSGGPPDRDGA